MKPTAAMNASIGIIIPPMPKGIYAVSVTKPSGAPITINDINPLTAANGFQYDDIPVGVAQTTREFGYFRLHGSQVLYGSEYTDEELAEWAARARPLLARGTDVYVYFDNDNKAYAPGDAARLDRLLAPFAPAREEPLAHAP